MSSGEPQTAPLVPLRLLLALVAVGMVSLVAFFALLAYAPDFRDEQDSGAHALSKSAIGFAALRLLLVDTGVGVDVDHGNLQHGVVVPSLTILTPGVANTSNELRAINYLEPRLIILPKWLPIGDPLQPGRVVKAGMIGTSTISALLKSFSSSTQITRARGEVTPSLHLSWADTASFVPRLLPQVDSLQTISGADWKPIIVSARGGAVLARWRRSDLYVLADPDFMNTHGLRDLRTANMALSIVHFVGIGSGPVVFDVTLNGFRRSRSLLREIFAPPFVGATFCAVLAAALLVFQAFSRFGSPDDSSRAFASGKRAIVANTADLIHMLRREPQMASRYAALMRNLVLEAAGWRRDRANADEMIRELEGGDGADFATFFAQARASATPADTVRIAHELFHWKQRVTHAA